MVFLVAAMTSSNRRESSESVSHIRPGTSVLDEPYRIKEKIEELELMMSFLLHASLLSAALTILSSFQMEEDGDLPKTLVKLRKTTSDSPRPASTPPTIVASAVQDEDDEEKIIAELEVKHC